MDMDRTMDKATPQSLARRYADGELTIHELRRAGHRRMIELLSDLDEIGRRPPLADMIGPNTSIRRAGIERLASVLRR